VKKIQEGDFEAAQRSMAEYVRSQVEVGLEPRLSNVRQEAYREATQGAQIQSAVDSYRQQLRAANPDLAPFERYMEPVIAERVQLAQQAGRITTPQDFIREFRAAADAEVSNLRTHVLATRGQGKDEAMLRSQQVLSSIPLTPQQVQSQQSQGTLPNNQQGESSDDYFTRRRMDEARRRGLA
jgi:hypothetical protein